MIRKFFSACLCVMLFSAAACAQGPNDRGLEPLTINDAAKDQDQQLRRDIGEMLLVGFRGMNIDKNSHILRDIQEFHIGGVILFEYDAPSGTHNRNIRDPKQVQSLCTQLQEASSSTLLIGIDQEGGRVCRLKAKAGFDRVISPQQMAAKGADTVRHYARVTAKMLHRLGINLNFAPCVDVNINPDCPVIGKLERSFGSNPKEVARLADIWMQEAEAEGVISCLKHFPGHGSSTADSHHGLVDVTKTWQRSELIPYTELFKKRQVPMVMSTHVVNGQLDDRPATLSETVLNNMLRDEMGFKGVIITDDMGMGAIADQYDYAEAVMLTIMAGADMLCIGNNSKSYNPDVVPETFEIIYNLVREGRIPAERIHQSASRIRALKATLK